MQKVLSSKQAALPWNGTSVRMFDNLESYFSTELAPEIARYLPTSITLFSDPEVDQAAVMEFLSTTAEFLAEEIGHRRIRCETFNKLRLFTFEEIESFLTARRHAQPWAIYYSKSGGLGILEQNPGAGNRERGVLPCSAVRHHGVAWKATEKSLKIWLATGKRGLEWDLDSDIGHESAHAAFAPVPLFAQGVQLDSDSAAFTAVHCLEDLQKAHLARLAYLFSEIAVVTIRGEQRSTETGLPVPERQELFALLELSHQLMPMVGFDRALAAYTRINGSIDVKNDQEVFELAAPVIRLLPCLTKLVASFHPPTLDWYRTAGTSAT